MNKENISNNELTITHCTLALMCDGFIYISVRSRKAGSYKRKTWRAKLCADNMVNNWHYLADERAVPTMANYLVVRLRYGRAYYEELLTHTEVVKMMGKFINDTNNTMTNKPEEDPRLIETIKFLPRDLLEVINQTS